MSKKQITTEILKVTPAMCTAWLEANEDNRKLSQEFIDYYTRQMVTNSWPINGESLKFDPKGNVLDGQHRMWACIQANTPFNTLITRNLPRSIFNTLDSGKIRTAADILSINKEKNVYLLAAALKHIGRYYNGDVLNGRRIANREVEDLLIQHPAVREYAAKVRQAEDVKWCAETVFLTAWYIASRKHKEKANNFFESLINGTNLTPGSPILMLRNKFIDIKASPLFRLSSIQKLEMIAIVWNLYLKDKTQKHIKLSALATKSSDFPKFN